MSEKETKNATVKGILNDNLKKNFIDELGSKARVERTQLESDYLDQLREVIADVGRDLEKVGAVPKGMTYRGSLCVHVYTSGILKTAAFATTSPKGSLTVDLADGALRELTGGTMESFGKRRQKLRSGF